MASFPSAPPAARTDDPEDEELIQQVLQGQTTAFEPLMRRYNERVYRTARAIVRDEFEAEDVMQQAYVNAFAHLHQFHGTARFSTWLTRIVVNESLGRMRRRQQHESLDEDHMPAGGSTVRGLCQDPEQETLSGELRVLLERAIDTLPDGTREVFVLRDVEGLSTAQTAECLRVSDDAVKTRLSRGRAALRRALCERIGTVAAEAFRFYRPRCDRVVAAVLQRITVD